MSFSGIFFLTEHHLHSGCLESEIRLCLDFFFFFTWGKGPKVSCVLFCGIEAMRFSECVTIIKHLEIMRKLMLP